MRKLIILFWFTAFGLLVLMASNANGQSKMEKEKRSEKSIWELQHKHPGIQQCARCGIPQFETEIKSFMVGNRGMTWVLCDYCWNESDLEERLAFYKAWYYKMEYWFGSLTGYRADEFGVTMEEIIIAVNKESK